MKKKPEQRVKNQNVIASINQSLYHLAYYLENYASALRNAPDIKNVQVPSLNID
jgi:hypothetical protein